MNILTLVRQVPDAEARVKVAGSGVDLEGATLVVDGMDEYGVEEALRLREGGAPVDTIIALAVGPQRNEDALRTALAMGVDRAIHVETDEKIDAVSLSKIVAQVAQAENAGLILVGGQEADWDSQALGAATAERLGWPQLTWTNELKVEGDSVTGRHDVDEGNESFRAPLPAVVTTQQGLNEPRYPTLPNIMKAKKKELRKDSLDTYGVQPRVRTVNAEIQTRARLNKMIDGKDPQAAAAELLNLLRNEAKVIA
ncbi:MULTISPECIES: electron transfer flavoprotein subunit beta/FixA family protein [Deinococcus]|jgi:Electron transfer flavoprotein, beta subunit|uniref:Electron transfer flavoprotein subunit beta n=1 Tax=Deinococcus radiodurans (strain ATCC 13939 / DSM 20539 / JCM 16871 / CCUG 27074 / LMG 4051 / NBRC 15346 / NCIMB 9279 / VKM B-1422 / R1) TaxID=243230 RepID=Q9RVQ1_DEIRA|nr:electron transfer flavoprotein subunit beta/FixA family protein [Deinococcus radiodurans]AAF10546.1 electron transfer flavoprotein, beta subunit [Deinococcus radiodurans R1 = ATCC 13939 = DSM 20539]ANC71837.1 electron transfer flavoprotein subunit beta [Deinococcus radiodurans R1 = ATCC 13939 = DSM 20539]QEM70464.1 electron transfer flavoprotein beta subunit/FixA family protein [Deinococcus radiodurans]QIP29076.1 electron transfer flavoprotein subunit beta/FixA family protein [Deinococcus ra